MKRRCELSIIVEVEHPDGYTSAFTDLVQWCKVVEPRKVGESTITIKQFYDTHDWEDVKD